MITVSKMIERQQPDKKFKKKSKILLELITDRFCTKLEARVETGRSERKSSSCNVSWCALQSQAVPESWTRSSRQEFCCWLYEITIFSAACCSSYRTSLNLGRESRNEIQSMSASHCNGNMDESLRCYESSPHLYHDPNLGQYPAIIKLKQK